MRRGSTEPRVFTPPKRELTPETSLGFAVVDFAESVLGVDLLPWQKFLFVHALEIEGDLDGAWVFRFRTVLILVARQQGKTMMSEILALFFLYALGVNLIIGTSTNLDAAEEVWDGVVDIAESNGDLAGEIEDISPLVAATMALGAATAAESPSGVYESVYETRGVLVV